MLERLANIDIITLDKVFICIIFILINKEMNKNTLLFLVYNQTGTLTEGKPTVSSIASFIHKEHEILQLAAAVEKTASHPIAKAIINKAELLNLNIPVTSRQLVEPGFGTMAEVDGCLVAVGGVCPPDLA